MKMKLRIRFKTYTTVLILCLLLILSVFFFLNVSGKDEPEIPRETLAAWQPAIRPGDAMAQKPSACSFANKTVTLTRSNDAEVLGGAGGTTKDSPKHSYYSRGWSGGGQWWQLSGMSTQGYSQIEISFYSRGSETGPKNFALEYSTDGDVWYPIAASNNELITYSISSDNKFHLHGPYQIGIDLEDLDEVSIRFINFDTRAVSGEKIKSSGTNYIADIIISGIAIKADPP